MEIDFSAMEATMDAIGAEMMDYPLPHFRLAPRKRIGLGCPHIVVIEGGQVVRCGTRIGHADEQELILCRPCQDFIQGMI
jgi:hypothetical protein